MPAHRKPSKILEFSGAFKKNPARGRARANEPKYTGGIGEPPDWLDAHALEEWRRVTPHLDFAGVCAPVENTALAAYCLAVSHLRKAQAEIFRDGVTIMTESGLKKHPAVGIVKDCQATIRQFSAEFGITPASRSKVQAAPKEETKNEFAAV